MSTHLSSVPAWQNEINERISAFADTIGVSVEKTKEILLSLGIDDKNSNSLTMLDSEEYLPAQDLFKAFVDTKITQIAKVRFGMKFLRGKDSNSSLETVAAVTVDSNSTDQNVVNTLKEFINVSRPKSDWTDQELLAKYEPGETEVIDVLRKKSRGRHFIVFNRDGSINPVSLSLLKVARNNQPTQDRHLVDGKLVKVYRAGEFLPSALEESPFYSGIALVNGICGKSGTDWNGIPLDVRQLVRIHVTQVEVGSIPRHELKKINKDAKIGFDHCKTVFDEAYLRFETLSDQGKLPTLKLFPSEQKTVDTGFSQ